MMSLANTNSDIGQSTLNQVSEFLICSMNPCNIGNDRDGAILSCQVLLLLAVQRGKLSLLLQWIHQSILVARSHSQMRISTETLSIAIHHIRSINGKNADNILEETSREIDLEKSAKLLLAEFVVNQSPSAANQKVSNALKSDAFLWGSNSSHQLAESGSHEKILAPKKTNAFQDVNKMEAGQYCTFVIHDSVNIFKKIFPSEARQTETLE